MRNMMIGLSGWAKMQDGRNEAIKVLDTAITVVATLMVAVTYVALR